MSKKQNIANELKKGTSVEDICTELEVSTGYVYRIKREIDESEGDKKNSTESEDDTTDDLVIDFTSGDGSDVEKDNKDLVKEEITRSSGGIDRVGGVKKRKRTPKKNVESDVESDVVNKEGGSIKWIKRQWKKMLLILSVSILSIVLMLSFLRMKPKQTEPIPITRYPMIAG